MECENLSYSKSRDSKFSSRFGSNFASRHKKTYLLEYQQSLTSPFRASRQSSMDKSTTFQSFKDSDRPTPPPVTDLRMTHYSSLLTFKQKMWNPLTRLSQDSQVRPTKPSFDLRVNYDRLGDSCEIWNKINLKVLQKAKKIIQTSGVEDLTWTYKRQLRQFCVEVLKVLD